MGNPRAGVATAAWGRTAFRHGVAGLRDVILGLACAGCGTPGELLCPTCTGSLHHRARPAPPTPTPAGMPSVWAVAAYDGAVRAAICALKEHGRLGLVHPLGRALAVAARASVDRHVECGAVARFVLVGVPSSPRAVRQRGQDATARLARSAASELRIRHGLDVVVAPALALRRTVSDQVGLSVLERSDNVAGAFHVPASRRALLAGRSIVLVDDVVTTGATLVEAARAIEEIGLPVLGAAVIAATRRRAA